MQDLKTTETALPLPNTKVERIEYKGWPNCYRIVNGETELVATADVGPRIIRCGFVGGQNLFAEIDDQLGKSGEPWWMIRGGHRLWAAPETVPDTYSLDNSEVRVTIDDGFISLLQPIDQETQLQKEISIRIEDHGEILVTHRIENTGPRARELSPWALTMMAKGGVGVTTFPPRGSHDDNLLPTNPLVMWAYTDFSDPRWTFTPKYLVLRHDPAREVPQKAGLFNERTFGAYSLGSDLFVKWYQANSSARYPDMHCSFEMFANSSFLELETLGPLIELKPDSSVAHLEHWFLRRDIHLNSFEEPEIDRVLGPALAETAQRVTEV